MLCRILVIQLRCNAIKTKILDSANTIIYPCFAHFNATAESLAELRVRKFLMTTNVCVNGYKIKW